MVQLTLWLFKVVTVETSRVKLDVKSLDRRMEILDLVEKM